MTKEDYMHLPKERLAEMLAERDKFDELARKANFAPLLVETYKPSCYNGGPCTNPHHDCINCPRQGTTWGGYVTTGENTITTTTPK